MTSMATLTLEEKRLKQLKQQLFGKEQPIAREIPNAKRPASPPWRGEQITNNFQITKKTQDLKQTSPQTALIDPISLKRDLSKIIILSFLAISIQLTLFFAIQNGLIRLF